MSRQFYLAEDNPDHAELIDDMLDDSHIDYKLSHYSNGLSLIDGLPTHPNHSDIILLDIKMPKLNGLDTLKRIRQIPAYQNTTILIITTSSIRSDINTAHFAGANGFISKPLTFDDLKPYLKEP
ncbi:response regulator [Marinagarivorans algicola]|uniref:response regulator n=1 Tax=Marinagarivorans algicola TaxID=1513270 RepID=UPI0006B42DE9|nr:response regulator [Marinagarivorans algicola]